MILLGTPNVTLNLTPLHWGIIIGLVAIYFGTREVLRRIRKRREDAITESRSDLNDFLESDQNDPNFETKSS